MLPPLHGRTCRSVLGSRQIRIGPENTVRQIAGASQEGLVGDQVRELKPTRAGLPVAEKMTGTSQLEISLGQPKAIIGVA